MTEALDEVQADGLPAKVLFCGDREVSAGIVSHITGHGGRIVGLGLASPPSPFSQVIADTSGISPALTFYGRSFTSAAAVRKFEEQEPDLGVCCGFSAILPPHVLKLPRWGWVNVHRSYLPYNRGLDPLQWAVIDGTPAGVSVHVMTEEIDAGAIVAQAEMPVLPTDGADALETRADVLALDLFRSCWSRLQLGDLSGTPQDESLATYHSLADCDALRQLDRNATMKVGRLLDILRCYSGANYSATNFGLGLLRTRFTVHTRVRVAGEPVRHGGAPGPVEATDGGATTQEGHLSSEEWSAADSASGLDGPAQTSKGD